MVEKENFDQKNNISKDNTSGGMTRREFLLSLLAGGAVTEAVFAQEASGESYLENPEIYGQYLKAISTEIDFAQERLPITPEVKNLISTIAEVQENYTIPGVTNQYSVQEIKIQDFTEREKQIYERLKGVFLDLPEYSADNFNQAISFKLPVELARYGIFAKINPVIAGNDIELTMSQNILSFFNVEGTESFTVATDEGEKSLPVTLIGPLEFDGVAIKNLFDSQASGQTIYKNIAIYNPSINQEIEGIRKGQAANRGDLQPMISDLQKRVELIKKGANKDEQLFLATTLAAYIAEQYIEDIPSETQYRVRAHESGHFLYQNDEILGTEKLVRIESFPQFLKDNTAMTVRDEILGMLGELRFSKKKEASVATIAGWMISSTVPFQYRAGAEFVMEEMAQMIVNNPGEYDVAMFSDIDPLHSAIISLPEMAKNHPELIVKLASQILDDTEKIKKLNLYDPSIDQSIPRKTEPSDDSLPKVGIGLGAIVVVGGGIYYGMKKYSERRELVRLEREAKDRQKNINKKGKHN